jgi:DNA polymerase I-like protein with 3'-5' exonuclease and polymerase domains
MCANVEKTRLISRLEEVPAEVDRLLAAGVDVGFDIETTGKESPYRDRLVSLAFKPKRRPATVVDVRHFGPEALKELGRLLSPLFCGEVVLVGQNLKFDLSYMLVQCGLSARRVYDTMLAEQVIRGLGVSSARSKGVHFSLAEIAARYGVEVSKEERAWFVGLDQREAWWEVLPVEQVRYIRQDVSAVHLIKEAQQSEIARYDLGAVIDLEMRALPALVGIEVFGVQIDREGWLAVIERAEQRLQELSEVLYLGKDGPDGYEGLAVPILEVRRARYQEKWKPYEEWMKARDAFLATRRAEWEARGGSGAADLGAFKNWSEYKKWSLDWWYERNGRQARPTPLKSDVNLGSWMQVRDGFNALGIPVRGVSEEELEPYRNRHPLVGVYLEYSQWRKLVSVYGQKKRRKDERSFIELLDENDRLHASYQQIGADTGRMSSYAPNFQQIPADGVGAELRKHVIAAPGYVLVVADFSNIELRIVAELSGDRFLLDAFASGEDVHAYTAKVMFGLSGEQATKAWTSSHNAVVGGRELASTSYRKVAKTINYMLLYGAGARRLASMLSIEEKDAEALLKLYYETFATAIGWLDQQKARLREARDAGESRVFAVTRSGRRRWLDIPPYPSIPQPGERMSVEAWEKYEEARSEWRRQIAGLRRQLANTPVQGLSADITKLAAALWYERVGYHPAMKLVAVVHDEFLVEALDADGFPERAAAQLGEVMCEAMRAFLCRVDLGEVTPVITRHWEH